MKFFAAILFVGITSIVAVGQQPPPPPPQPPAANTQGTTATQPSQSPEPQATPTQPSQSPESQATPTQPIQNPDSQATPTQPSQSPESQATSQKSTEPVVPTPPPNPNAQDPNLPQKEQLEAELARIQDQEDRANIREKVQTRLRDSRVILREMTTGRMPIPNALLQKARCVIIVPSVKKAAFAFGVNYGRGVMTCRLGQDFNGPWSAPAMYAIEGGNFGLQIGLQGTDLVLLVMNDRGVDSLLGTKFKVGGDASLAAGPIGRHIQASTDAAMRAKIVAFSRAHGLFAGVSLDGSTLRPDNRANQVLYGRVISARQIVRQGDVVVSRDGAPLIRLLD